MRGDNMFLFRKNQTRGRFTTGLLRKGEQPEKYEPQPELPGQELTDFRGTAVSDIGCVRPNNEDNYVLDSCMNPDSRDCSEHTVSFTAKSGPWHLAGVFDGMGGGELGELASRDAARIFVKVFEALTDCVSREEVDALVRRAFQEANNAVVALQEKYSIFGTTGTVLCTTGTEFKIYHLGDSRAYLIREADVLQITKDQTLAQMKLEVGMYREDDPAAQADKHKLTEYIGRDRSGESLRPVESYWIPVITGDRVLLCSDGLYDMCSDRQITSILRKNTDAQDAAEALVRAARAAGGVDNITCVVVRFP